MLKTIKYFLILSFLALVGCISEPTDVKQVPRYTAKKIGYIDSWGYIYEVEMDGNSYILTPSNGGYFSLCPKTPVRAEKQ